MVPTHADCVSGRAPYPRRAGRATARLSRRNPKGVTPYGIGESAFKSEERKQLGDVAASLRQLADKLATSETTLKQAADELTLSIPNHVVLEVKVEEETRRGGKKQSLELEIEWTEDNSGESGVTLG